MTRPLFAGPDDGPDDGPEPPYPICLSGKVIKGFGRGGKQLNCPTANLAIPPSSLSTLPYGVYYGWSALRLPPSHPDRLNPMRLRSRAETLIPAPYSTAPSKGETAADPLFPNTSISAANTAAAHPPASTTTAEEGVTVSHPPAADDASSCWLIYPMVMSLGQNPYFHNPTPSFEIHILHLFTQDFYGEDMRVMMLGYVREERDYTSLEGLVEDIRLDCEVARRSLGRRGFWLKGLERGEGAEGDGDGEGKIDPAWLVREDEEGEFEYEGDGEGDKGKGEGEETK